MTREEHLSAIKQADHEYYDLDNPAMTDAEYDELRQSYIDKYGAEDLNYVPGNAVDGFEKFRHPTPVTSLGKWTKGVDDEADLKKQIEKLWPVEIQPKYDGLTVVAYPNADGSCRFVTRGLGGEVGEVLPNFIPEYEGAGINNSDYAIRGEVYITQ
jgi:DNA ligase (NAD+)